MRRSGTVHSLQEKRLSRRQKLRYPVPVLPPAVSKPLERGHFRIEEMTYKTSDSVRLIAMSHRQMDTEAEYLQGYASSSSQPDEPTGSVSETSSTINSG